MSSFLITIDLEHVENLAPVARVEALLRDMKGVTNHGPFGQVGTLKVSVNAESLDAESIIVHAIEDLPGVIDVRLLTI